MDVEFIINELDQTLNDIDISEFERAKSKLNSLLTMNLDGLENKTRLFVLLNISSQLIDIGHFINDPECTDVGMKILIDFKSDAIEMMGNQDYYYNLANAKSEFIRPIDPFDNTFHTIESLVEVKNLYWKALKSAEEVTPENLVNLGNALKRQFRLIEALDCYDKALEMGFEGIQPWVNRSDSLISLNKVSNSYSLQLIGEIKRGYLNASESNDIPLAWRKHYLNLADNYQRKIDNISKQEGIGFDPHDADITTYEYEQLPEYTRFCLDKRLILSEHSLYCHCAESSEDCLSLETQGSLISESLLPMKGALNRFKSEFIFARHLYYEYLTNPPANCDENYALTETIYSERLGMDIERLKTAYKSCFSILDKIGLAICELYNLYPNGNIYFQNLWRLNLGDRRQMFDNQRSPGLLALYSIATDLNVDKGGEWSFLKDIRNCLEHNFVIIHDENFVSETSDGYGFTNHLLQVSEKDMLIQFERLLQLTRSAIFSFVFAVRQKTIDCGESPNANN